MWWAGCLLLVLGVCSNAEHGVFKAKPGAQFEHMSVDRTTGQIYVGAVNQLYQLDQDLNILNLVQSEEMDSTWMNNHNKALLINYINLTLITCGSLTGTCMVRSLHNISVVLENGSEPVVANDVEDSTIAFIAPGPNNKHVMYVGVTFTGNTTKNFRPGIATRSLEPDRMFRILFNNNQLGTRMFVNFNNQALFIINYVYGFASKGFSYFLTTQRKTVDDNSPYISKLVRICHNDSYYYSYTEIPITCHSKDGKQYNLVQTGFVGKPGSNLAKTLAVNTEDDVLFAVFSTSSESNRPGNNSALCVYSLASIRHTFTDNIRACYSGLGNQGLDFLYGVKACEKITTTIDDDFCGQSYNYPIGGEQSVEAYTAIQFNVRATAVTATSTGNDTVVFIGTQNGHLKKIIQENISHAFEYADVKIDPGVAVNADIHLEPNGTYLYVMTEQRLSKVKVQECHLFKTCWECLTRKDPYCGGWCTLENKCSPRSDCKDPDSWISYQSWTNPTIDGMDPSSREILVAFNTRKQLSVKLRNIFHQCIATIGFYCQFTIDRKKWNVKATLLGEMINCESTHFYHTLRLSNINASIAVIWGRSKTSLNNPDNVHVNIYSCQDLANNCDLCLNLNDKYKCGWCQDSHRCEISDHCNGLGMWLSRNQTCSIPEITSFQPKSGPWEGGTNVTINGINLGNDFKDIKDDVSVAGIPCQPYVSMYNQTTQIVCQVEHLRGNKSTEGPVTVRIRDFTVQSKDNYQFVDPIIRSISPMQGPSYGGTTLHITGFHLNAGSSIEAFIDNLPCRVISVEYEGAYCITSASDRHGKFKFKIKFDKGTRYLNDGFFEYVEVEDGNVESVALKIAILTIVFLISIGFLNAFQRNFIENTRDLKSIRNRIKILELRVAAECRETFGELQTELTDLREELKTSGIPFLDYRTYTLMNLFPNSESHISLQIDCPDFLQKEHGLELFRQLIMNKTFLLLFIGTLESNMNFLMSDRVNVASLIMLVLQTKMEYCTDILKTLLAQLIDKFMKEKSNPYLLLRQTESVAEKMLSSWFTFLLYPFLRECAGEPLYLLFQAMKYQLNKGPEDVITGEARYSISEKTLIRGVIHFLPMTVYVSCGGYKRINVKVLDCDTISQVKEKSLDAIYQATPFSKRPRIDDLNIEWRTSKGDRIILNDFDTTTNVEEDWKRVNTLSHYNVPYGARLTLVPKATTTCEDTPIENNTDGNTLSLNIADSDSLPKEWHLVKRSDHEDPQKGKKYPIKGRRRNKMVSEAYLTQLMGKIGPLQKFFDDLFETVFSAVHRGCALPLAVKFMFDFLDDQALNHGITDPEVVHTWKSNSLPLRFWVNLIKNPNFEFDIHKGWNC
uniref:Plexin-A4 n=1 Tax=Cacopsylla melanoneura TaxID=428564 RepID=A0A8D8Y662_9HEMI